MRAYWLLLFVGCIVLAGPHRVASADERSSSPLSQENRAEDGGAVGAGQCVMLLHGLGRSSRSMKPLESALLAQGYQVWNASYPSTREPIEALAETAVSRGVEFCDAQKAQTLHVVTHSLGGILIRHYLQLRELPALHRIVMLAPPNHGSEVADQLRDWWLFKWAMGPAGQQLGTGVDSVPKQLAPIAAEVEVGIIAGQRSSDPWFSRWFSGVNDGKVSVDSTQLAEMADFRVVDQGHTHIMRGQEVIRHVLHFLETGQFDESISK